MIIGYLTSDLLTSYSCTIWSALREVCRDNGASLLYFSGGVLDSPDPNQSSRNLLYDLVSSKNVDGILLNSGTIFHYLNSGEIEAFHEKYANVPVVSIGVKTGDYPAVLTDNTGGVRETVVHLVQHHRYQKIAFLGGPENNLEVKTRLDAYRETLAEFGIPYEDRRVVLGTFSIASGADGLDRLLEQNDDLDAVITANDDLAIGVMNRAQSRGIVVPHDLAICGFDDIPEAPLLSIPLSTARQPFFLQAQTACRMLIDRVVSGREHGDVVLETEFIPRRSCGCWSESVKQARYEVDTAMRTTSSRSPAQCMNSMKEDRSKIADVLSCAATVEPSFMEAAGLCIFDSLLAYLESGGDIGTLAEVDRLFNRACIHHFVDFSYWQNTVSRLIAITRGYLRGNTVCLEMADAFWQQVRIILQETSFYSQSFTKMQADHHAARLRQVSGKLVRSFELSRLLRTIREELPHIDIQACYLCLYDRTGDTYETSRLVLAYNESGEVPLPEEGIVFKTGDLIPRSVLAFGEPDAHIVEALFFEGEQLGYIFFKTNPEKVEFEELRQQISSAIKGALLTEAVRALALEQEKHARELQAAYDSLKENQEKMLLNQKMASLGRLTAGIAHEMNTPLATVRMAVLELESLIAEYRRSVGDAEVTTEDHRAIAKDMLSSTELIRKAAERAHSFVQGVRSQTRDPSSTSRHRFDIIPVIQEAILLLNHKIRKSGCPVNFTHPEEVMTVYGAEGRLSQVVTNLIVNAIDASKGQDGQFVEVALSRTTGDVVLTIADCGHGIAPEILHQIFDPMFTTKSLAEGTGLGLTIVHDIVHGDFGGTIDVTSKLGEGTVFTITIPIQSAGGNDAEKVSDG